MTCVVFDASQEPQLEDVGWMQRVAKEAPEKVVFVLNKADAKPFFSTMFRDAWNEASSSGGAPSAAKPVWVECCALSDEGAKGVMDALFGFAEEGEPLFPEDVVTDYPRKLAIADTIREKFLEKVDVLVNRPSQKPIVIGRSAQTIKWARKAAEKELSETFGVKVSLELWVKVEPGWMKNPKILAEMGYMGAVI